jgi:peptide/nickel transport system substrate-binding protein
MVIRLAGDITNWDPYTSGGAARIESAWMERLGVDDWTTDPATFSYKLTWRPPDYLVGQLAQGWEFTDANTFTVHIRKGVPWQNIAPANGREFVASDVVSHWNRIYGLNGVKGSPFYTPTAYVNLTSLTAPDKYTVVFKWSTSNPELIMETLLAISNELLIENPEAAAQWGNLQDWHHAIGTGPFIVTDFVSSSSATLVANPNYWQRDERYPNNRLPYVSTLKFLIITDNSTALAAMRSGKLDTCGAPTITDANNMKKTNPEILQMINPNNASCSVDMRNDKAPYNDIRVRQAMQLAINLPLLASSYYGGATSPLPLELTCYAETGWAWPYDQWPQDLKDQYTFNVAKAKQLLSDAGFPNGFHTDVVADTGADQDLLLVVQSFLAAINVTMDIRKMDSTAWVAYVQNGHLHDAMSMRSGGSLAFQYEPPRQLQRFQTGYSVNFPMVSDPVYDAYYPAFVAATSVAQEKSILRDANERVLRQHYVISLTESVSFNLTQPWLKGFNGQNYSVLYGFYLSRFWIDQKLKTSLGH